MAGTDSTESDPGWETLASRMKRMSLGEGKVTFLASLDLEDGASRDAQRKIARLVNALPVDGIAFEAFEWTCKKDGKTYENDILLITRRLILVIEIKSHKTNDGPLVIQAALEGQRQGTRLAAELAAELQRSAAGARAGVGAAAAGGAGAGTAAATGPFGVPIVRAVALPNCEALPSDAISGFQLAKPFLALQEHCASEAAFAKWFQNLQEEKAVAALPTLSEADWSVVVRFFQHATRSDGPTVIASDKKLQTELSMVQARLLAAEIRQRAVVGYAGVGKTWCAVARAEKLIRHNKKVLFIVHKKELRDAMRKKFPVFDTYPARVTLRCAAELSDADFIAASEREVIIDELHSCLDGVRLPKVQAVCDAAAAGKRSIWVFADSNQMHAMLDVGCEDLDTWLEDQGFKVEHLVQVVRNTDPIFRFVSAFYRHATHTPVPAGAKGAAVRLTKCPKELEQLVEALQEEVQHLVCECNVQPGDIAVLVDQKSPTDEKGESLEDLLIEELAELRLDPARVGAGMDGKLVVSHADTFQGLERKAVIYVTGAATEAAGVSMYKGMSRAVHFLTVLSSDNQVLQMLGARNPRKRVQAAYFPGVRSIKRPRTPKSLFSDSSSVKRARGAG